MAASCTDRWLVVRYDHPELIAAHGRVSVALQSQLAQHLQTIGVQGPNLALCAEVLTRGRDSSRSELLRMKQLSRLRARYHVALCNNGSCRAAADWIAFGYADTGSAVVLYACERCREDDAAAAFGASWSALPKEDH